MHSDVSLIFDAHRTLSLSVQPQAAPGAADAARAWLAQSWESLGCEPLRPSGKVLLLDQIIGVTDALGYETLAREPARARELAEQIALAIGRPRITVDLPGLSVDY